MSDKVKERWMAVARRTGQERVVAYLLALWTGLRRSELGQLEWGDVELDTLPPRLRLRSLTTKSKRGDTIALHPEIADALRAFRPDDFDADDLVVSAVPNMKVLKADLKFAGIEFETPAGRADLHAMRKSLPTTLATSGVGQRIAQHHLRHTDPRLTACTYTDESLLPTAATISALPWVGNQKAG
ncbi:MAG: tyrosine-type recombinase/integrase [Pyrinomonadaceae bacterium]|nr:tyrosine-type recombinase/integrase [Phycisphaerales bacterium]